MERLADQPRDLPGLGLIPPPPMERGTKRERRAEGHETGSTYVQRMDWSSRSADKQGGKVVKFWATLTLRQVVRAHRIVTVGRGPYKAIQSSPPAPCQKANQTRPEKRVVSISLERHQPWKAPRLPRP